MVSSEAEKTPLVRGLSFPCTGRGREKVVIVTFLEKVSVHIIFIPIRYPDTGARREVSCNSVTHPESAYIMGFVEDGTPCAKHDPTRQKSEERKTGRSWKFVIGKSGEP